MGTKPGKQRPAICIQPSEFCQAGLGSALIVPLTKNLQSEDAYPIRIRIPIGICGLEKPSEALIEQFLAWDISLFKKDLGVIPEELQEQLKSAIIDFLDLI